MAELLRQRDLVRAHLAWLEREIAQAQPATPAGASQPATSGEPVAAAPATGFAPAPVFAAELAAEVPLVDYQPDVRSAARDTRRGCLVATVSGFLLLAGLLAAVFFLRYRDRPLLFMERDAAPAEKLVTPAASPSARK